MAELSDTTLRYAADGSSKRTDALGMRVMQRRVWDVRDSQYILVKSPPASGKSRAAMFIGLDKLQNQGLRKVIVAVPERSIGASFRDTKLTAGGFFRDWKLDRDLCGVGSETGSKVAELIEFLGSSSESIALCTHATLRFAFTRAGIEIFDGALICVDELHHASSNDENKLGSLLRGLMDRGSAHVLAMTGSYFRGDTEAILHPEDEARFERVIYTYYEQLNGYEYLKTLHIGFRFYQGRYLDRMGEALDPALKTIVHIPHVGSSEAVADKMFEVDAIVDTLGDPLGVDPVTGFVRVRNGRRILKIANLVDDGPGREKVMASLRKVKSRDDVDVIIALGMAKEGFDWIWCEHVLTVGYRGSLTEVVQIIGRATRDAPGKTEARFTNLVSAPFAKDDVVSRAVNDMLKAISVSLLMEQVMAPTFKFRTHKGSDDMTGQQPQTGKPEPVTNAGEIEVINGPMVSDEAKRIIDADFPDLVANVQSDPRTITVMLNPDAHHADVMHDVICTDIVRRRYPHQPDNVIQDVVTLFGARTELGRAVKEDPSVIQTMSLDLDDRTPASGGQEPQDPQLPGGGDNFIRATHKFLDVRDLQVDLLGGRREFIDAYEILSKALNEDILARLHGEVRAMKVAMTQDEAEKLMDRIKDFIKREGREPNLNAPNGREVRLADALAFMRRLARQRRADLAGADAGRTAGAANG
ncbi:DEAD/DEAH box helicase [Methylorubrum zatmanii]|uniref:DEAD/DEAH box helicase n=1 Tax=Methylorubrum zatmanii TaxID=29429 RepID=A0ABW1WPQ1_9HYPH|nr:DEAD/DEAH box helicase [Methylorubrum zatmanii]